MEERESNSCMVENPIFSAYQSRDYNMLLCILSKNMDIVVGMDENISEFPYKIENF